MRHSKLLLIASLFISSSAFSMFCPTNFNTIKIGDTIEQVNLQCGKPDSEKTTKITPNVANDNTPQEWIYLIKANVNSENSMRLSILFKNKKSLSITVNGAGIGVTNLCNNTTIQVGYTTDTIKKACGNPAFINRSTNSNQSEQKPQEIEITEYKYTNTSTPMTLVFESGILKEKK